MTKLGTIMTICFFMPSIMPSICDGSLSGLGGATGPSVFSTRIVPSGLRLGSTLRYAPVRNDDVRCDDSALYADGGRGERAEEERRICERRRARLVEIEGGGQTEEARCARFSQV